MRGSSENPTVDGYLSPLTSLTRVWISVAVASWSVALALTTVPPLADPVTLTWVAVAVVVLVAMVLALSEWLREWPAHLVNCSLAIAITGWGALMFRDGRWSVLTFVLYAMCFAKGREVGVALAAVVSGVWFIQEITADSPTWTLLIPFVTFAVGAIISIAMHSVRDENVIQAELIAELQATRHELAVSERERGTLEERARFAGEIHDTLAQGFTSIVLLSRATQRNHNWDEGLTSIESVAEKNLTAARRLVAAMRPVELENASLAEALQHQLDTLSDDLDATLTVAGTPVALDDSAAVSLLRAAQEALLNVRTHARASTVHVTLSYVGSDVLLDVVDDGIGFTARGIADRGTLTGGQGLAALRQRAETLGGGVDVETGHDGGTAVSIRLPVRRP